MTVLHHRPKHNGDSYNHGSKPKHEKSQVSKVNQHQDGQSNENLGDLQHLSNVERPIHERESPMGQRAGVGRCGLVNEQRRPR